MKLDDLRTQIDAIDDQLLGLLAKRMDIVEQVGALKRENGVKGAFIRPKREDEMMKRILGQGAGHFPKNGLFAIWRAIISASLQVENPFKVFTTKAANKRVYEYFGAFTEYVVLENAQEIFDNMGKQDVGVLPNSVDLSGDLSKMPAGMKVFANIGDFVAFANIEE